MRSLSEEETDRLRQLGYDTRLLVDNLDRLLIDLNRLQCSSQIIINE